MRPAVRNVVRGGWASLVAIVSLAIGIAANATIFSLVQAVAFPDLLYPDPSRIVVLESRNHARAIQGMLVSMPDAADIAASVHTLTMANVARTRPPSSERRRAIAAPAGGASPPRFSTYWAFARRWAGR